MTTISLADFRPSPDIILGHAEHQLLLRLAMTAPGHGPDDSDDLLYELNRALVVPESFVPRDVVRIGSTVTYQIVPGDTRTVRIVLPGEEDQGADRLSVLDTTGVALIGLRPGQTITLGMRDADLRLLTVIGVTQPETQPEPPSAA
ncbi:MAG: nucleoside diphosphate kinase regulator [Hyphomicrobiales bacterium]|nr:MAG: nucleoside diphosphate kinase regulator [Hyphomicrobiales bacterium]